MSNINRRKFIKNINVGTTGGIILGGDYPACSIKYSNSLLSFVIISSVQFAKRLDNTGIGWFMYLYVYIIINLGIKWVPADTLKEFLV